MTKANKKADAPRAKPLQLDFDAFAGELISKFEARDVDGAKHAVEMFGLGPYRGILENPRRKDYPSGSRAKEFPDKHFHKGMSLALEPGIYTLIAPHPDSAALDQSLLYNLNEKTPVTWNASTGTQSVNVSNLQKKYCKAAYALKPNGPAYDLRATFILRAPNARLRRWNEGFDFVILVKIHVCAYKAKKRKRSDEPPQEFAGAVFTTTNNAAAVDLDNNEFEIMGELGEADLYL